MSTTTIAQDFINVGWRYAASSSETPEVRYFPTIREARDYLCTLDGRLYIYWTDAKGKRFGRKNYAYSD